MFCLWCFGEGVGGWFKVDVVGVGGFVCGEVGGLVEEVECEGGG